MEGFIDINLNDDKRIYLILNELNSVLQRKDPFIDLVAVTRSLKNSGYISDELLTRLVEISNSEEDSKHKQILTFFELILNEISAERVYVALCTAECSDLFKLYLLCKNRKRISHVGRLSVPHSKHSNDKYRFIKTCVDNNCYNMDKRQKLDNLSKEALKKIHTGTTQGECQKYLEEKVLIDLHYVQLYGDADFQKRFEILHTMKDIPTKNLDRTSLELTFNSKMAVTYAKIGRQTEAEEHIRQTLAMCDRCRPCFATIMALNDVIYAYQELCFKNRSEDLLRKAKDFGQLMYHVMTCDDEEIVNQWKRIILLFMAMTYLNISHEYEIGDKGGVSAKDINQAHVLIKEVKKVSSGIETRREMVLNLCQSRIHEHSDKHFAIVYVKKAFSLLDDGCIRESEKSNIKNYLTLLDGGQ